MINKYPRKSKGKRLQCLFKTIILFGKIEVIQEKRKEAVEYQVSSAPESFPSLTINVHLGFSINEPSRITSVNLEHSGKQ